MGIDTTSRVSDQHWVFENRSCQVLHLFADAIQAVSGPVTLESWQQQQHWKLQRKVEYSLQQQPATKGNKRRELGISLERRRHGNQHHFARHHTRTAMKEFITFLSTIYVRP